MATSRTQIAINIDPELLRRMKLVAVREGQTVASIVRQMIEVYVEHKEQEDRNVNTDAVARSLMA